MPGRELKDVEACVTELFSGAWFRFFGLLFDGMPDGELKAVGDPDVEARVTERFSGAGHADPAGHHLY